MAQLQTTLPERIESFIRSVDEATTPDHISRALGRRLRQLGFDLFAYWLLWPAEGPRKPLCLTNYPDDWAEYYLNQNYSSHDFIARHASRHTLPFVWKDVVAQYRLTPQQKLIFSEGAKAGIKQGSTVPIHGPGNAKATFSVANDMEPGEFSRLFHVYRHEIHLMANYVHEKIMRFGRPRSLEGLVSLTPREMEILTWVAKGKSRWEVGMILGINEDTVRVHLKKIRQKFGASNTTHAIAIALLHGMLIP